MRATEHADFMNKFGMGQQLGNQPEQAERPSYKYLCGRLVFEENAGYFYQWIALVSLFLATTK